MHYRPVEGWGRLPEAWSFIEATSVAVDTSDNVWVFNRGAHPVIVFDREGRFLRSWGEGVFRRAHGITMGPDGTVWLTDDLHHTVRQFTAQGNLPHNIVTDNEGLVYVADRENHRVQIFDAHGQYLSQWNNLHRPCGLFAERRNGGTFFIGELPTHLAVNKDVPNLGARVSILSLKGELLGRIGGRFAGEQPGEFVAPHGCVVDSRGDLYVAEVSWTAQGSMEAPPRDIRSLQKFERC